MSRSPMTYLLLGLNIVVFLLSRQSPELWIKILALWPVSTVHGQVLTVDSGFRFWQLLSYGFLHGNPIHILLNVYALWLFGRVLEVRLGSARFLVLYLTCIVGSALFHILVQQTAMVQAQPVIGASGGTFGLLMAFAYLFPDSQLFLLIPPMPVKAKWFVVGYGVIELLFGVTGTANGIAHFAHLGGLLTAYLLLRYWNEPA